MTGLDEFGYPVEGSDWVVDTDELGWVIGLWMGTGEYHVDLAEADGYAAGPGGHEGRGPHSADFQVGLDDNGFPILGNDWIVDTDELGWLITLWMGSGQYHFDPTSPSGYSPGPAQ
jgi:hypothetical protein